MLIWRDAHVPSYVPRARERWGGAIFQSSDVCHKYSRIDILVKFDLKPGLCYTLSTSNIRRTRPKACPDSMEGKLTGPVFNVNGKNISHSKVEKGAEIQVARRSTLLPLRPQKRLYA